MDSVFGLTGKGFVILAADTAVAYSIMKLKVKFLTLERRR